MAGCGGGGAEADGPTTTVTVTETVTADPEPNRRADRSERRRTVSPQEPNVGDGALRVGQWREGIQRPHQGHRVLPAGERPQAVLPLR